MKLQIMPARLRRLVALWCPALVVVAPAVVLPPGWGGWWFFVMLVTVLLAWSFYLVAVITTIKTMATKYKPPSDLLIEETEGI